jgi:hypothetical protein
MASSFISLELLFIRISSQLFDMLYQEGFSISSVLLVIKYKPEVSEMLYSVFTS